MKSYIIQNAFTHKYLKKKENSKIIITVLCAKSNKCEKLCHIEDD